QAGRRRGGHSAGGQLPRSRRPAARRGAVHRGGGGGARLLPPAHAGSRRGLSPAALLSGRVGGTMPATALLETAAAAGMRRASDLAAATAGARADLLLPVAPQLRPLLPGLRRGGSVAVRGGTSVLLALLAEASASGAWSAVVGMPDLGLRAAAEAGVALERLALVPWPGPEWTTVVAALLDGIEVVVVAPPGPVSDRTAGRLAARARQRGSVLVACGQWPGAELTLTAGPGEWSGLGRGHGRDRQSTRLNSSHVKISYAGFCLTKKAIRA